MSGSFYRQAPVRDQITASLEMPPDLIELYGTLADAGNECLSAANDALRARQWKERPTDNILRSTEAALIKALRAIAAERGSRP